MLSAQTADWRDLMTPEELAAYEVNKDDPKKALKALRRAKPKHERGRLLTVGSEVSEAVVSLPKGPAGSGVRIKRAAHDVRPPVEPLPELSEAADIVELSDVLREGAANSTSCGRCGRPVGSKYYLPLIVSNGLLERTAPLCARCMPQPEGGAYDWQQSVKLSPRLRKIASRVWELHRSGMKQGSIAKRLSNQHQKVRQSDVSRVLSAIRKAIGDVRHAQYVASHLVDAQQAA
ncbi:MAG TPA: hypothetical protein VJN69_14425 [Candidatus Acidoferrales bacterium]|nr:hypothetical protein [Candidatus Acidoferrales bacterium]